MCAAAKDEMIGKKFGAFEITEKIGEGGMAVVYKANDCEHAGREVALKKIVQSPVTLHIFDDLKFRFDQEVKLLANLNHPNIVTFITTEKYGEEKIIVMELVRGKTLEALVRKYKEENELFPIKRALDIIKQCLLAMVYAHNLPEKPVVHRDIKPSNIMIIPDRTQERVKVMDWGVAKILYEDKKADWTQACGTYKYMAPEQEGGNPDPRSDIYSLGMTLYEMLTGQLPYKAENTDDTEASSRTLGDSDTMTVRQHDISEKKIADEPKAPHELRPDISESLSNVVMKAIEKYRDKRFQSAEEMLAAVKEAEKNAPRQRTIFYIAIAAIVAMLSLVYFVGIYSSQPSLEPQKFSIVTIESEPSGAQIFIDDDTIGQTPYSARPILAGQRAIRLEKNGYTKWEQKLWFAADSQYAYKPELKSLRHGKIAIHSSPESADVIINQEKTGVTPFTNAMMDTGVYRIEIRKPGYESFAQIVGITAETDTLLAVELKALSTLVLRSEPGPATIFVDGQLASENVPGNLEVQVSEGSHTIKFMHPQYGEATFPIVTTAGKRGQYSCYFTSSVNINSSDTSGGDLATAVVINDEIQNVQTPCELSIAPGTYHFSVRHRDFQGVQEVKTVVVKPSLKKEKYRLTFTLK